MANPIDPNNGSKTPYDVVKCQFDNSAKSMTNGVQKQDSRGFFAVFENKAFRNTITGSGSAMIAVGGIQPFIYFKTMKQINEGEKQKGREVKPLSRDPKVWYKGVGGFAISFIPTIVLQTTTNSYLAEIMPSFYAAAFSGGVSAAVVTPFELIMIQQQKTQKSFAETVRIIYAGSSFSGFNKGFAPTALREMCFTAAYLGVNPLIKEYLVEQKVNEFVAQMMAGIFSGIQAALISHKFDTAKTLMQGNEVEKPMRFITALRQKGGMAGWQWRLLFVSIATTVIPFVQEKMNKKIDEWKK